MSFLPPSRLTHRGAPLGRRAGPPLLLTHKRMPEVNGARRGADLAREQRSGGVADAGEPQLQGSRSVSDLQARAVNDIESCCA